MKKLLIVKTGTTYPKIREKFGDFENFIINQTALSYDDMAVWPAFQDKAYPALTDISAIIITGSSAMVTDQDDWIVSLSAWLRNIVSESRIIPILGICFGHQLLAQACGGLVDYHPQGNEMGMAEIQLTEAGQKDPLLGVLPPQFSAYVAHYQTVAKPPPGAVTLAKNKHEAHHALTLGHHVWGVQFHPEFNQDIMRHYIIEERNLLIEEGFNPDRLYNSIADHQYGKKLLENFIRLSFHE